MGAPMGTLSREQILGALNSTPPLLDGFHDLETQLQPNGFDLSLSSLARFTGPGQIGITNTSRKLAPTALLPFRENNLLAIPPGAYLVTFNEVVCLPLDLMAIGKPRSSLLRCGVSVHNAVWDAGYHGRSQALLTVYNEAGFILAKDARIIQMVFLSMDSPVKDGYSGQFQQENI